MPATATDLIQATEKLARAVGRLHFSPPVANVYNPLQYAADPHHSYLRRYGQGHKRVIFLGMNPGPFGMAQTGIPFGEIQGVRDWLGISGKVGKPRNENPARPVIGFDCERREVSGQRLWGMMARRFPTPAAFFEDHFVANYCPLVFMEASGRNITPDKLPAPERAPLLTLCQKSLAAFVDLWGPEWIIGVGRFAEKQARACVESFQLTSSAGLPVKVATILHPSPASPAANQDWAATATSQLEKLGVW